MQDNICLEEVNVHERLEQFIKACQGLANVTYGNDIMLTMGTDFTYSNAWPWCVLRAPSEAQSTAVASEGADSHGP